MLKQELGFSGFVVTDWDNVRALMTRQHVAGDLREAARMAITAGNDMLMSTPEAYPEIIAAVREGTLPEAALDEAVTLFFNGEPDTAKLILRDLVNATVGFESLAQDIHKPAKSLHRMLSKSGNPTMSNISAIFAAIKRALKVEIRTAVVMA